MSANKKNLILDAIVFVAFLVVATPRLTGNSIHEWLSLAFGAAIVTHLLWHWNWVVSVTRRFFKQFFHETRLNYVVDLLFFIAMTGALFSGIMISKDVLGFLGIRLEAGGSWKFIHKWISDISVILLAVHFGLHWKWIVANIQQFVVAPFLRLFKRPAAPVSGEPVAVPQDR